MGIFRAWLWHRLLLPCQPLLAQSAQSTWCNSSPSQSKSRPRRERGVAMAHAWSEMRHFVVSCPLALVIRAGKCQRITSPKEDMGNLTTKSEGSYWTLVQCRTQVGG